MFRSSVMKWALLANLAALGCESHVVDDLETQDADANPRDLDAGGVADAGPPEVLPNGCPVLRAMGDEPLLDDFQSSQGIAAKEGRMGRWFYYDDGSAGEQTVVFAADEETTLQVTSTGWTSWGSGLATTLSPASSPSRLCPYDATAYSGLSFRARGSGRIRLRLATPQNAPVAEGGECTKTGELCYDWPGVWVNLNADWTTFSFPFCSLVPEGWSGDATPLDPTQLGAIHFQLQGDVNLWLDELQFTSGDIAEGSAECAGLCPLESAPDTAQLAPGDTYLTLSDALTLHTFEQTTPNCGPLTRRYLSYVPEKLGGASDAPVVFTLHGSSANAESFLQLMARGRLEELAERDGAIIVHGNAAPGAYTQTDLPNSGAWRQDYFDDGQVDDVEYLLLVLDDLQTRGVIAGDNAVYLLGLSNGGGMVMEAAKRLPTRFAGVAPLMPFDGYAPFAAPELGGTGLRRVIFGYAPGDPGVPEDYNELFSQVPAMWGAAMGLSQQVLESPVVTALPDAVDEGADYTGTDPIARATQGSRVTQLDFPDPESDARLRVLVFEGAGHFWPNPTQDTEDWILNRWGFRNQDVDASDAVWDFLLAD
jgi:poly(3-hydroxybutyrate) depolymerase